VARPTVLTDSVTAPTDGLPDSGAIRADQVASLGGGWDIGLGVTGLLCVFALLVIGACVALSRWADARRRQRSRRAEISVRTASRAGHAPGRPLAGNVDPDSVPGWGLHHGPPRPAATTDDEASRS
jgi:hypothetical protein